jgi:hypothetical protein
MWVVISEFSKIVPKSTIPNYINEVRGEISSDFGFGNNWFGLVAFNEGHGKMNKVPCLALKEFPIYLWSTHFARNSYMAVYSSLCTLVHGPLWLFVKNESTYTTVQRKKM